MSFSTEGLDFPLTAVFIVIVLGQGQQKEKRRGSFRFGPFNFWAGQVHYSGGDLKRWRLCFGREENKRGHRLG